MGFYFANTIHGYLQPAGGAVLLGYLLLLQVSRLSKHGLNDMYAALVASFCSRTAKPIPQASNAAWVWRRETIGVNTSRVSVLGGYMKSVSLYSSVGGYFTARTYMVIALDIARELTGIGFDWRSKMWNS